MPYDQRVRDPPPSGHKRRRYADDRDNGEHLEEIVLLNRDEAQYRIQEKLDLVRKLAFIGYQGSNISRYCSKSSLKLRSDPVVTGTQNERHDAAEAEKHVAHQR